MELRHGKREQVKKYECPCCFEPLIPGKLILFPRQIWHPIRTWDFLRGYSCPNCNYLVSKKELENQNKPKDGKNG